MNLLSVPVNSVVNFHHQQIFDFVNWTEALLIVAILIVQPLVVLPKIQTKINNKLIRSVVLLCTVKN